jgi:hypothetical protein
MQEAVGKRGSRHRKQGYCNVDTRFIAEKKLLTQHLTCCHTQIDVEKQESEVNRGE